MDRKIYKSKFYAVNTRRGRIHPTTFKQAREVKSKFTSNDVLAVKGSDILACTAFMYYPIEEF